MISMQRISLRALSFAMLCSMAVGGLDSSGPLRFTTPVSKKSAACTLTKNNGGRIAVKGASTGLYDEDLELLLFVNPQHPQATGWYLQFGENGVHTFLDDGSWSGVAQLGNGLYPPKGGEVISLAVVAVTPDVAEEERARARKDPGRPRPGGLPRTSQGRTAMAKDVKVVLKEKT